MTLFFFFTVSLTILFLLDVLCFFNKKQPLLLKNKEYILLISLLISLLWTYIYFQTNKNVIKIDNSIQDIMHDSTCQCGYCIEPIADYYLNLGIMNTTGDFNIYLIDPVSNDTIANLSHMDSLKKIIKLDNL